MMEIKPKSFYIDHLPEGLPVFHQPFYLDAVTNGSWDVSSVWEGNKMLACMPFAFSVNKRAIIRQPPLTIYLGPYFTEEFHQENSLNREMEILEALESSLPAYAYYNQNWHPASKNWLPFYWKGYQQSTRYSYIISGEKDMGQIRSGYSENVKRNIKKSASKISMEETDKADLLFSIIVKTFARKNSQAPYDFKLFSRLIEDCLSRNCCAIYLARDAQGNIHAAMFIVWDSKSVYYMAGGIDDEHKNSGAMSLLFDKAITFAVQSGKSFDFEGSMIQSIEKFFRSFGSRQQQYFVVTKVPSRILKFRLAAAKFYPHLNPF